MKSNNISPYDSCPTACHFEEQEIVGRAPKVGRAESNSTAGHGETDGEPTLLGNGLLDILRALRARFPDGTLVIPGHGRLYDEADVVEYRDMLTILRDRIQDSIDKGETLRQVKAERPTLDYDGVFGASVGLWTTDMFIEAAYQNLSTGITER